MTSQALDANDDKASADAAVPRLPTTDDAGPPSAPAVAPPVAAVERDDQPEPVDSPVEIGGRAGPEPTRYGDWEMRGRCIDF